MDAQRRVSPALSVFPASHQQAGFYFVEQAAHDASGHILSLRWDVRGSLRAPSIEGALNSLIARHEALRTRLVMDDGDLLQEVMPHAPTLLRVSHIDVRNLSDVEREARITQIAATHVAERFDLSQPTPMRATLVRRAPDHAVLLIAVHHAVIDGASVPVMQRELAALIAQHEGASPSTDAALSAEVLPALALQYGDYARWQEACRASPSHAEGLAHWAAALADLPYCELPSDHPRRALSARRAAHISRTLPAGFEEQIKALSQHRQMSVFGLSAAALALTLHRQTASRDISFGTPLAGRDAAELEGLIGPLLNPVILRYRLDACTTIHDLLQTANLGLQDALGHGDIPFDAIVRRLAPPRDQTRTPLVSVFFALQQINNADSSGSACGPVTLSAAAITSPGITHDLHVEMLAQPEGWRVVFTYDADRFASVRIDGVADAFVAALSDILTAPDTPLEQPALPRPSAATAPQIAPQIGLKNEEGLQSEGADIAPILARLRPLWAQLLDLPESGTTWSDEAEFFDLGGHSLLALRLLSKVESAFDLRPDIADFLAAPTLSGLAATLQRLGNSAAPQVASPWAEIPLHKGDPDAPLLVTVNQPFLYRTLAKSMPGDTIALHLTSADAVKAADAHASHVLAALCTQAARRVDKLARGRPVILTGLCIDGVLARDIASHMSTPPLLMMIDAWAPGALPECKGLIGAITCWRDRLMRWGQYGSMKARGQITWGELASKNSFLARALQRQGHLEVPTQVEKQEWAINLALVAAYDTAYNTGRFTPYRGETLLIQTRAQTRAARKELFGWQGLVSADTPLFDLAGWHEESVASACSATRLAAILTARIARR